MLKCSNCGNSFDEEKYFRICPKCGTYNGENAGQNGKEVDIADYFEKKEEEKKEEEKKEAGTSSYGQAQADTSPYGQAQADTSPYGQAQADTSPYGQPQAGTSPYGQAGASPYGQPQAGQSQTKTVVVSSTATPPTQAAKILTMVLALLIVGVLTFSTVVSNVLRMRAIALVKNLHYTTEVQKENKSFLIDGAYITVKRAEEVNTDAMKGAFSADRKIVAVYLSYDGDKDPDSYGSLSNTNEPYAKTDSGKCYPILDKYQMEDYFDAIDMTENDEINSLCSLKGDSDKEMYMLFLVDRNATSVTVNLEENDGEEKYDYNGSALVKRITVDCPIKEAE